MIVRSNKIMLLVNWFKIKFNISAYFVLFCSIASVTVSADKCGCKILSTCYSEMLDLLYSPEIDEAYCVEDAAVGTSSVTVYLTALQEFCGDLVNVTARSATYDQRNLYEVVIEDKRNIARANTKESQIIIIDAGQEGGTEAVQFALYIIEQLVACQENKEMIQNIKWVIMPNTNPDGTEYSRYKQNGWRKNLKVENNSISFGVDISRNFDENWSACSKGTVSGFAGDYPGPSAGSEKETAFIKSVFEKHLSKAKVYISIRRDGHHIAYPYAYSGKTVTNKEQFDEIVSEIAQKVNARSSGVHIFKNDSIYHLEGMPRCGHSVDYAFAIGIKWPFEMRVFLGAQNRITSMFQTLPRGYESTLRSAYFTAIREFYNLLTNQKKYGHLTKQ